jgi:hypothetical protein
LRSKASLASSLSILLGPIAFYLLIVFQASLPFEANPAFLPQKALKPVEVGFDLRITGQR